MGFAKNVQSFTPGSKAEPGNQMKKPTPKPAKGGVTFDPISSLVGGQRKQSTKPVGYFFKKKVLISGASSGLGQALSYWYLNQGAIVIMVA
jgi:NADPH:quinone reductase-like Zn-dependent oxidoreductase